MVFVVGVDLRIIASTRYRHIRQPAIDEFFSRLFGVDMDEHAVGGLSLAAVARYRVAVVEMRMLFHVERNTASGVHAELQVSARVHLLDGPQFAVRNVLLSVRRCELHAVASAERTLRLSIESHTMQPARIVSHFLVVFAAPPQMYTLSLHDALP